MSDEVPPLAVPDAGARETSDGGRKKAAMRFMRGKPAPRGFRRCARCRGVFPRDQVYTTGHCKTCEPIRRKEWLDAAPGRRERDSKAGVVRKRAKRAEERGGHEDRRRRTRRSRYQPLVDHLAALTERETMLTDAEIEAILGAPLPTSAYTGTVYWTDARFAHVQRWRALGWRARRDRRNRRVHFVRDAEQPVI